jgi:hypothetical protein
MDHRKAIAGDNGIRFELVTDTESMKQLLMSFELLFQERGEKAKAIK